jgi:hypothetical protein
MEGENILKEGQMMMKREKDSILKEAVVHLYSDTRKNAEVSICSKESLIKQMKGSLL